MLALAAFFAFVAYGCLALGYATFPMTRDPNVPFLFAAFALSFLAALGALSSWVVWAILRRKAWVAERIAADADKDSSIVIGPLMRALVLSESARRWFRLPPPTR